MSGEQSSSAHQIGICVFCGSSSGSEPEYLEDAKALGASIAEAGWRLIYGGASVGLMGAVADAALAAGGEVIGVIPQAIVDREVAHRGLTELHFVDTMHERKALMATFSQAFVALPGGFGTLDEFMEILTWAQLGIHSKPCILVNAEGYYDDLLTFLDHAVKQGFLKGSNRQIIKVVDDSEEVVPAIRRLLAT
jgi:hypothetical protein